MSISGLRSGKGQIMFCLTARAQKAFLQCADDPARLTRVIRASGPAAAEFHLRPGEYSLLVIHDENGNGKLDTMMGIPREGFGFSRNPPMRMGPPQYRDVHFAVPAGQSSHAIHLKYLL